MVSLWALAMTSYIVARGIPFDRATQILMIVTAAMAFSVGTVRRQRRVLLDWLPFFGLLYGYDYSRGAADTFGRHVNVVPVFNAERTLFGGLTNGEIPSLYLQQQLFDHSRVHWWEGLVALVYCSHFVAPWVIVGVMYVRDRERWERFARRVVAISLGALVTYFLYPAAPPWFAAREGLTGPVARISTRGWEVLNIPVAGEIVKLGQGVVNQVAAVPSLHAGMALTIVLFFWPTCRRLWQRTLFVAYVVGMVFALVYGGEHYVVDALLGWLYAVVTEIACRAWESRRRVARVDPPGVSSAA